MRVLVTGATGFIGGNLLRELLEEGFEVRALIRRGSVLKNLEGLEVELVYGDLRDRGSLERALEGCQALFHVGALYAFWAQDPKLFYRINVDGTRNVLEAALKKGIRKVVYTSTQLTIGVPKNGLGNEGMEVDIKEISGHYRRSKYLAEKVALRMNQIGLPVVVVNPTVPVGPRDIKPTPTGKFIVDFLNRRMPAYVDAGLNLIAVEDVARGHILALERGKPGERYILGNRNLTFKEILEILERITGIKAPRLKMPLWAAFGAAYISEFIWGRVLRRYPPIQVEGVRDAALGLRFFDCSKARNELGLPQTSVEEALERAVRWFRENGYVR